MLGTSDAWSMSHLSQQTSKKPAYYVVDCRISVLCWLLLNIEWVENTLFNYHEIQIFLPVISKVMVHTKTQASLDHLKIESKA